MKQEAPPVPPVDLVVASKEMLEAELEDPQKLAAMLDTPLPQDWPPEHHDEGAMRWMLSLLDTPEGRGWGMSYIAVPAGEGRVLVGTCGYHGPPQEGVVEIGYSVVPSHQRRGIATQASRMLVDRAFEHGVHTVRANTLAHLAPSIGVLRKLGFQQVEPAEPGVVTYALSKDN